MRNLLKVEGLCLGYGNSRVLDKLNLSIVANGRLGVIGCNGSGKSSLAHYLAGVIPGFISAYASPPLSFAGRACLVMQTPSNQFFGITVSDEVSADALAQFSLSHLAQRRVFELSEGQKQKINLVANISAEPELLLLDEPLELLDPYERRRFLSLLAKCRGRAIVWFDKDERFLPRCRKIRLSPKPAMFFPRKKHHLLGSNVLDAQLSVKRGDISFGAELGLREGEKVALIGRNGSGKSTLLHSIASLVKCGGKVRKSRRISLAFQNPLLSLHSSTVRESVADERRAEALGLGRLYSAYPFHLSKGQQRLVSLASLAPGTIQLIDEPTTWLDEHNRAAALNVISEADEVMLIATHDEGVAKLCDRTLLVENGVEECSSTKAKRFFRGSLRG